MVKFTYNNAKNTNIDYITFKSNYGYYFYNFYKENIYFCSSELNKLIVIC